MPEERPTVVSFWVLRPEEHPEAEARNYPGMLRVLQRSCDRLGLKHVVLTDVTTAHSPEWPEGVEYAAMHDIPKPLMQACTAAQAAYLDIFGAESDTLFVGADCIFKALPVFPAEVDIAVTYRGPESRMPINTGAVFIRERAVDRAAPLFRAVANRCGKKWCDDQRALVAELSPLPPRNGIFERHGMKVGFLPMFPYNVIVDDVNDPADGAAMLHFKSKTRKALFFSWAERWGFA